MKSKVVHVVAHCADCNWFTDDIKDGKKLAKRHSVKCKHRVTGEVGIYFIYDGNLLNEAKSRSDSGGK